MKRYLRLILFLSLVSIYSKPVHANFEDLVGTYRLSLSTGEDSFFVLQINETGEMIRVSPIALSGDSVFGNLSRDSGSDTARITFTRDPFAYLFLRDRGDGLMESESRSSFDEIDEALLVKNAENIRWIMRGRRFDVSVILEKLSASELEEMSQLEQRLRARLIGTWIPNRTVAYWRDDHALIRESNAASLANMGECRDIFVDGQIIAQGQLPRCTSVSFSNDGDLIINEGQFRTRFFLDAYTQTLYIENVPNHEGHTYRIKPDGETMPVDVPEEHSCRDYRRNYRCDVEGDGNLSVRYDAYPINDETVTESELILNRAIINHDGQRAGPAIEQRYFTRVRDE